MIKLTDRLQLIADQIEKKETMADIGTDHGFLPISLWERGICPSVIMADISPGSLDKARENARKLYPAKAFDLRLGDGIRILKNGEVDDVVIAGMGGALMVQILSRDPEKSGSFKKLILQPRSGQGLLRFWLIKNGFGITRESLVREGAYICEVLTASPPGNIPAISREIDGCGPEAIEYEAPPWIFSAGGLAEEFVARKLRRERQILENINKSRTPDLGKVRFTENNIKYLDALLGGV